MSRNGIILADDDNDHCTPSKAFKNKNTLKNV